MGETPQGEVAVCNTVAETHGWVRFPPLPPMSPWSSGLGRSPFKGEDARFKSGWGYQHLWLTFV
jgi:hypothetical protein